MGNCSCCVDDEAAAAKAREAAADKQRAHLEHSASVLVTICAAEFSDPVLRLFFCELVGAIDSIGATQDPPIDALSNPQDFVSSVINTADMDSFVEVEVASPGGLQRIQMYGGGGTQPLEDPLQSSSQRAGSMTDGVQTSLGHTRGGNKKKPQQQQQQQQRKREESSDEIDLDALAAEMDNAAAADQAKTRLIRIWDEAKAMYSHFSHNLERVKLIKAWILNDHTYSGSMAIDPAAKQMVAVSGLHQELSEHLSVKFLNRIHKRPIQPQVNVSFPEMWSAFQEYALQWPELDAAWEVAVAPCQKRAWAHAEAEARKQQAINDEEFSRWREEEEARLRKRGTLAASQARGRIGSNGPVQASALDFLPEQDVLTKSDLTTFLITQQTSQFNSSAEARRHADRILQSCGGHCDRDAFCRFLADPELNTALRPQAKQTVYHDMNQPLTHYFIATSYKTFMNPGISVGGGKGGGGGGGKSAEVLRQELLQKKLADAANFRSALMDGCRVVELELWDDPAAGVPVVWHNPGGARDDPGSTGGEEESAHGKAAAAAAAEAAEAGNTSGKIPLETALTAISEAAFVTSSFPLIVVLDMHVKLAPQQRALAVALKNAFGAAIVSPTWQPGDPIAGITFTPQGLLNRVLLVGRRGAANQRDSERQSAMDARATIVKMHAPAYAGTTFDQKKNVARSLGEARRQQLHPQLAQLLALDTFGGVVDISKPVPPNVFFYHCSILEEQKALGYASKYEAQTMKTTSAQMVLVRPEVTRGTCSNMNAHYFWNAGVQMPAITWGDGSYETRLLKSRFALDNGGCGMVLKPAYLTTKRTDLSNIETFSLTVEVLSALSIPALATVNPGTRFARQRLVKDPHVLLNVEGPYLETAVGRKHAVQLPVLPETEEAQFMAQMRQASRRAPVSEGTFHPIYCPPPSLLNPNKNSRSNSVGGGTNNPPSPTTGAAAERKTASQIVAEKEEKVRRKHLLSLYKNKMQLQVSVPQMSTLVIQIIDDPVMANASFEASKKGGAGGGGGAGSNTNSSNNNLQETFMSAVFEPGSNPAAAAAAASSPSPSTSRIILAEAFLPVHLLQEGIRSVQLYRPDESMSPVPDCRVLLNIKKGPSTQVTRDQLSAGSITMLSLEKDDDDQAANDMADLEAMIWGAAEGSNNSSPTKTTPAASPTAVPSRSGSHPPSFPISTNNSTSSMIRGAGVDDGAGYSVPANTNNGSVAKAQAAVSGLDAFGLPADDDDDDDDDLEIDLDKEFAAIAAEQEEEDNLDFTLSGL